MFKRIFAFFGYYRKEDMHIDYLDEHIVNEMTRKVRDDINKLLKAKIIGIYSDKVAIDKLKYINEYTDENLLHCLELHGIIDNIPNDMIPPLIYSKYFNNNNFKIINNTTDFKHRFDNGKIVIKDKNDNIVFTIELSEYSKKLILHSVNWSKIHEAINDLISDIKKKYDF